MKRRNIYLILADENLFHPYYLLDLIKNLKKSSYRIVGITIAKDNYRKGFLTAVKNQIQLWGLFPFIFIVLNSLARSTLDLLNIPNNKTVKGIAKIHEYPLVVTNNVNDNDHLSYLRELKIDFIVSSNGQIFRNDLLSIPKTACINRHSSLLPKYGGSLPVFRAMENDDDYFGVSAHYMVEKVDQGDILGQASIPLESKHSLFYNYLLAFDRSASVTLEAMDNALKKKIVRKFRKNKDQYYRFPDNETISSFKKNYSSFNISDILSFYKMY